MLYASGVQDRFDVRHPDKLLILEVSENTAQSHSAIGRPKHKGWIPIETTVASRLGLASASRANSVT
jgi:hypothetical protein